MREVQRFFLLFGLFIFILGCAGPEPGAPEGFPNETSPQPGGSGPSPGTVPGEEPQPGNASIPEPPEEEPLEPFYFSYSLHSPHMSAEGDEFEVVYYFEERMQCNGESAYAGVSKTAARGSDEWFWTKTMVYLDDSSLAVSDGMNSAALVFDDAESARVELNLLLFLQSLFSQAGEEMPDEWSPGELILLKNIALFSGEPYDVSVVYSGEGTVSGTACSNFSVSLRQAGEENAIPVEICQAELEGLPVTTFFLVEANGERIEWKLEDYGHSSSGVPVFHQCLEPIICPLAPDTSAEVEACGRGKGEYYKLVDRNNCYRGGFCLTSPGFYAQVSDGEGRGVANLEVCAWEGTMGGEPDACAYTDADGVASFPQLGEGTYTVAFNSLTFPASYSYAQRSSQCEFNERISVCGLRVSSN